MAAARLYIRYDRHLAPGDYVVTTALLRDIQLCYPSRFSLTIECNIPSIFQYNPHASVRNNPEVGEEQITIGYKDGMLSSSAGNKHHFLTWLHRDFNRQTGLSVYPHYPRPDLHLSDYERRTPPVRGRYWVIMAGGKQDVTVKHWDFDRYQQLADALSARGVQLVQSGSTAEGHVHPRLKSALDLVGWGYLRELIWLIAHAEGVICPITCGMHIAAAFNKPCVVIAGGREEWWWEAYTNEGQFEGLTSLVTVPHRYLHTLGQLNCCEQRGCWRNKVVATDSDRNACTNVLWRETGSQPLPACMSAITVPQVTQAVLSYYRDGTLSTLSKNPTPLQLVAREVEWQPNARNYNPTVQYNRREEAPVGRWGGRRLGDKITILVGCYDTNLTALRCTIDTIERSLPRHRYELRVGLLQPTEDLLEYVRELSITQRYLLENATKYELLRTMTNDQKAAVQTPYFAWFDAGSWPAVHSWLDRLAKTALDQTAAVAVYGTQQSHRFLSDLEPARQWFASRSWYRGRKLRTVTGFPATDGDTAHTFADAFFVARTDAWRQCLLPDPALRWHGALVLGEQLYQNGFLIKNINVGKSLVYYHEAPAKYPAPDYPWLRGKA